MTEQLEQRTWFRLFFGDISWYQESKEPGEPQEFGFSPKMVWNKFAAPVVPSFSSLWKSDGSSKLYLTQMLFAINWRYWQAGKKSHMRITFQSCLMQARFIEIHQVFAKK